MGAQPNPFANWGWREWVPFLICVAFGQDVMKSMDVAVRPLWGFWSAFATKWFEELKLLIGSNLKAAERQAVLPCAGKAWTAANN